MSPEHFVSTPGVGLFSGDENPELHPERAPGAPRVLAGNHGADPRAANILGSGGYVASKWACERLLERTNKLTRLPVWIHRPSTILREGADAEGKGARLDWLNGLVQYARVLQAVPAIKNVKGALDIVHPRTVCTGIVDAVLRGARGQVDLEYVHEVGDVVVSLDSLEYLLSALEARRGYEEEGVETSLSGTKCEILPMAEWLTRATRAGLHLAVAMLIENMDKPGGPNFPRLRGRRNETNGQLQVE
ncbi:hypothetical protein NPX13_g5089 [Xylaria arbuscula]|uniref:Thioester reductase (TE) domain-containing protein n=1 Tax=Xylaria arbuscula TaxID=114810 RepID=A0A9W8NF35_9PEZI|nr:hypothetical protein NPX13_g5089 [Xylaria arbuscula]